MRDTAAYDSYMVDSVLPLSSDSDTGDVVLSRGIGLSVLLIPLHKVVLSCKLVQGRVAVGMRPALPMVGIHLILGNGLAGGQVWADASPSPVVAPCPVGRVQGEGSGGSPEVLSSCTVTRARAVADAASGDADAGALDVLALPLDVSPEELQEEQKLDLSLTGLFEQVLPAAEVRSTASGYFLQDGLLFRQWIAYSGVVVGDAVFQLVVLARFRPLVLKVAHDDTGHFGVRKTYLNILRHFFLAARKT